MTCTTFFAGILITRPKDEECKWIEALNSILSGESANCKEALQGLEIIRKDKKIMLSYIGSKYYNEANSKLAKLIASGGCVDW